MKRKKRVAVLMGGVSREHKVSLDSGARILANLPPDKYKGFPVVIGQDGLWSVDNSPPRLMLDALQRLSKRVDVVFIALHGPNGEDGTVQSLFHLLGIPYTGSDYYASSLAMNKARAKDAFKCAGLLVPRGVEIAPGHAVATPNALAERILSELGPKVVIKPAKLGSSVSICITSDAGEVSKALSDLGAAGLEILAEEFVAGRELTSSVIDDPETGEAIALPLVEIRPRISSWFDYKAKYEVGGSEEICPAPIPEGIAEKCRAVGLTAHRVLGCRGMSRTDIVLDSDGNCIVLETNTIPGFTQTSLLPQAAAAMGISYSALLDLLIREAMSRR